MQTGYENLWAYQNNRPEKVVYLPKSAQYSHVVVTDSNKQMQNGVLSSHSNSYISPQNNIASVHQTNQPKVTAPQYMWQQSPVYFWPAKSSQVNNIHPQQDFSTQSNNISYSSQNSQAQQNCRLRYLLKSNVSVSQVYNSGNNNIIHSNVIGRDSDNINIQTPRIRVKDVFSLNNNGLCNPLLSNSLYQPPKDHSNCSVSYTSVHLNSVCGSGNQAGFIDSRHLPLSDPPPLYYEATDIHSIHHQPFYQQNAKNQFHPINNQQRERNIPVDASNTNAPLPEVSKVFLSSRVNQETTSSLCNVSHISPPQINTSHISEDSSVPVTEIHTQVSSNQSCPYKLISREEDNYVKISIPHTGQSTYIRLNESNCASNRSNLSLPCLSEANEHTVSNSVDLGAKEDRGLSLSLSCITQDKSVNPPSSTTNQIHSRKDCSTVVTHPFVCPEATVTNLVRKNIYPKEPFIGVNRKNLDEFLNSTPSSEMTSKVLAAKNVEREIAFQAIMLKQENSERKSPDTPDNSFPDGDVFNGIIKTEENHAETSEGQEDENQRSILRAALSVDNEVQNLAKVHKFSIEKPKAVSKPESNTQKDVGENSENKSTPETKLQGQNFTKVATGDVPHSSGKANNTAEPKAASRTKKNRKNEKDSENKMPLPGNQSQGRRKNKKKKESRKCRSEINRQKLDMLIQFLEKDEDSFETDVKSPSEINERKMENGNHSRRKLSKSSIVKNKNNTREMISLVSPKNFRREAKNQSVISRTEKPGPEMTEEGKDVAEINKNVKRDASIESQKIKNDSSKFEPNIPSESVSEKVDEKSQKPANQGEEKLLNSIRAFHNVSTSCCKSCCSVSPVDSFWINVATAEVRCLNCLTKVPFPTEERNRKSKCDREGSTSQEEKGKKGNENVEGLSHSVAEEDRIKESKQVLIERQAGQEATRHNEGNFISGNGKQEASGSRRQSSGKEEKTNEKEAVKGDQCGKGRNSKEENATCGSKLSEDDSKSKRKEDVVERTRNFDKNASPAKSNKHVSQKSGNHVDSSRKESPDRRKSSSKEHHTNSKTQVIEDTANKSIRRGSKEEEHSRRSSTDSWDKSVKRTKESCVSHKEEQKNSKHQSEKSKVQITPKDCGSSHKSRTTEQIKTKELNSGSESKPKTASCSNDVEKHRKRKNSGEDCGGPHKVRIVADGKGDKQVPHYSNKTKPTLVSNEIKQFVESSGQQEKRFTAKDDLKHSKTQPRDIFGKEIRQGEIKDKKQSEENDKKRFFEKIPKLSCSEKSNESTGQPRKSDVATAKPLKESQNNKIPNKRFKNHGYHDERKKKSEEKSEKQNDKKSREREEGKEQRETKEKQKWERNWNKKKCAENTEGKFHKTQTENRHGRVHGEGGKVENRGSSDGKQSATLFEELIRKTKKLTRTLLNED